MERLKRVKWAVLTGETAAQRVACLNTDFRFKATADLTKRLALILATAKPAVSFARNMVPPLSGLAMVLVIST